MKRILLIPLLLIAFRLLGQDTAIVAMEYYVDVDPGYGQASAIDISSGLNINEILVISTDTLTLGFHKVFVRGQNTNGNWGLPMSRLFQVRSHNPTVVAWIDGFEYFFDDDPGHGNATFVTAVSPNEIIEQVEAISTDVLAQGFHRLFVRALDEAGRWGITEARLVFVDNSSLQDTVKIAGFEYFFDEDPGFGNADQIDVNSPTVVVNINELIATTDISLGFHNFYIRPFDEDGTYGITQSKLVFVDNATTGSAIFVDGFEYFMDNDPGYGNGTFVAANTPSVVVDFVEDINTDTLSIGFHTLFIRPRDENGRWGMAEPRLTYVDASSSGSVTLIDGFEYFFDHDPGHGLATFVAASTAATSVNFLENIVTDTLSVGFHNLYIRAKNLDDQWGITESRLVYVDLSSASSIIFVDGFEYFFDEDPGYGNGIFMEVASPDQVVNIVESISTDGLQSGFHQLYVRAHGQNGQWGIAEPRVLYIDSLISNELTLIDRFEYFIDTDPGYGNAAQIPVVAKSPNLLKFNVSLISTPVGPHVLGFRAKDQNGTWSVTQTFNFKIYSEGAELDSVSLVKFYQGANGASWTNKSNWLSGKIDTWFGITVDPISRRVLTIDLSDNNLEGKVAREFGFVTQATQVDLADNQLKDSIPETVALHFKALQSFDLRNNQLNGLPNLASIPTLQSLLLEDNLFTFEDLTPNAFPTTFTYTPQGQILQGYDSLIGIRQTLSLIANVGGVGNTYQWFKDSLAIAGANGFTYTIPSVGVYDTATYYCEINNPLLPDLTISTNNYTFAFSESTIDSLSLVALYDSLDGDLWTNNANWKQGPINTWHGVEMFDGRLKRLNLSNNNLTGILPPTALSLDLMDSLNLSGNNILGDIPQEFKTLGSLTYANLSDNDIAKLPDNIRSTVPGLEILRVENNRLQFGSIESNLSVPTFVYAPQDSILVDDTEMIVNLNDPVNLTHSISGLNNQYQWLKNGVPISGALNSNLVFANAQFEDEGFYQLRVSNFIVPGLTLHTENVYLIVSGLRRDSLALVAMYDSTNGDGWTNKSGWKTSPIQTWHGVNVANDRVAEVILANNNLEGILPPNLKHLTALSVLNIKGNKIVNIPDLTSLGSLQLLDVSDNRLQFGALEPNRTINGLVYAPQDSTGVGLFDTAPVGSDYPLSISSTGSVNTYQWFKESTTLEGQTSMDYTIEDLSFDNMGRYFVEVKNSLLPNLTLVSRSQTVLASANISGKVLDVISEVGAGKVYLFKVNDDRYDSAGHVEIQPNGDYLLNNIVLDDYVLLAKPDETEYPDLLPTYFGATIDWEDAETLALREDELTKNITLVVKPGATSGRGTIQGFIEEEIPEDGRLLARARVSGSGVSIRRESGQGRVLGINSMLAQDLVLYLQTNDNGEFMFPNVPKDKYFIKFDYPGIPMDLASDVNLEIRGFVDEIIEVEAIVDGGEIVVTKVRQTGIADNLIHSLKVYPNPTKGALNIVVPEPNNYQLQISDIAGRKIMDLQLESSKINNGIFTVNLSQMEAGSYIINLISDEAENYVARVFVE